MLTTRWRIVQYRRIGTNYIELHNVMSFSTTIGPIKVLEMYWTNNIQRRRDFILKLQAIRWVRKICCLFKSLNASTSNFCWSVRFELVNCGPNWFKIIFPIRVFMICTHFANIWQKKKVASLGIRIRTNFKCLISPRIWSPNCWQKLFWDSAVFVEFL